MAINTANRRSSAINVGSPWRSRLPFPDSNIVPGDRFHVAFLYSGLAFSAAVFSAAGAATVSGVGKSTAAAVYAASGTATVSGVGKSTAAAVFAASGVATVSGVGKSTAAAAFAAMGSATASGVSSHVLAMIGSASGSAIVVGVGDKSFSFTEVTTRKPLFIASRSGRGPSYWKGRA